MTKTTHVGSNRLFGLSKAVLVYSDAQEAFATVHEAKPSPDGGAPYLDAGQSLTVDFRSESTFRAIQSSPGVLGCPGSLRDRARGKAIAGRRRAILGCRPVAYRRFSEATGESAGTDDPMRNSSAQCSGIYAGHAGLVAPAATPRDVLRWFQRWAHAERHSVSAAAARVQGMRFRAVGSGGDGKPPPAAGNHAHGRPLLEL